MSLLVVGSLAFDSIETPSGRADDVLGGSATYFAYAASYFTKPRLVGVVGEDFPEAHRRLLAGRGIDLDGLATEPGGKTFRWKGRYHQDMNTRDTLEVHLNVLGTFNPVLPETFRDSSHVFLANSTPAVQLRVLEQVRKPKLVLADTMNLWIETQRDDLLRLLPKLDGLFLNDGEARQLTEEDNLVKAGEAVRRLGPKFVIVKKGEHGAMLFSRDGVFVVPAYPTADVLDPTGAGDSFGGGVVGYLDSDDSPPPGRLRRAMAYGTVVASLTVEGFGLDRLTRTDRNEIDGRLERYREMLAFEEVPMPRTRTFVAVDPGKAVRDRLVAAQEALARAGAEVKWVEPENLHVTLLFLGEVDDREIPSVCRLIAAGVRERPSFPMTVETLGCFPDPRRPRVLWAGVGEGARPLVEIHDALEPPLFELGYRREERRYTPHITLGRVRGERGGTQLAAELAKRAAWQAGEAMVNELLIMGSELTPRGPVYTVLGRARLRE